MTQSSIRVLIVDDSAIYRKIVRDVVSKIPGVEVVGLARDGMDAIDQIELHNPDLITLDVEMPGLSGIVVLREIRRRGLSTKAIMVSSLTSEGARATLQALEEGAFDFVTKPVGSRPMESAEILNALLRDKIEAFKMANQFKRVNASLSALSTRSSSISSEASLVGAAVPELALSGGRRTGCYAAVVIGVSTGGPDALRQLLPLLPADFPLPILVVQHMPAFFTKSLADSLNAKSKLIVKEAEANELVQRGKVLIAPGGMHMKLFSVGTNVRVQLTQEEPEHGCRPAADVLFRSAAQIYGSETLCVIMTGMGFDGTEGIRMIKKVGGSVIAQDAATCVVWGMPRIPTEEGLADSVVSLHKLPEELCAFAGEPVHS